MFTRNFYKGLSAHMCASDTDIKFMSVAGTEQIINANSSYLWYLTSLSRASSAPNMYYLMTAYTGNPGVIFGTGNETATFDDYKLSGEVVTGFTHNTSIEKINDDSGTTIKALYTVTNTSDSEITINEIAMVTGLSGNTGSTSSVAILERTVLDSPVTIPAGGVGQVTYTIRFNYPTE